jgi:hypothetical protein
MNINLMRMYQGLYSKLEAMQSTLNDHALGRVLLVARYFEYASLELEVCHS